MYSEPFPFRIHRYLRAGGVRTHAPKNGDAAPRTLYKEYVRMSRIELPSGELDVPLGEALKKRTSTPLGEHDGSIAKDEIGTLLHHAIRERENGRRPYPSGGALYPIETYLIARGIAGIPDGAHHYHPRAHAFEYLWSVPESSHILRPGSGSLVESSPAIIVLTALWNRNYGKYSDFAYYLGLIESGHAAQNILLSAAALKIPARPIAGFDDAGITKLLDLDQHTEQPVYVISIGT